MQSQIESLQTNSLSLHGQILSLQGENTNTKEEMKFEVKEVNSKEDIEQLTVNIKKDKKMCYKLVLNDETSNNYIIPKKVIGTSICIENTVYYYEFQNKQEEFINAFKEIFEDKEIRSIWDSEKEEYYFSVVDVISALTDSNNPRNYWNMLKKRMKKEEQSELSTKCVQLKMKSRKDGKSYSTDTLDTKGILRLIESVPSPKAEPFKLWLANLGSERIDEVFDPEIAINRAVNYYRNKDYTDEWIKARLMGIVDRFKLTDIWKEGGINKPIEYALLTNEIYKGWSGMKANEYKELKGLRKESLRDNMTDIEVALTNIGEIATRDIAREEHPQGLKENLKVAKRGGGVAKGARDLYEKETKKSAISKDNALNYRYVNEQQKIESKVNE